MAIRKPFFIVPHNLGAISSITDIAGFPSSNLGRHDAIGLTWKSAATYPTHAAWGDFGSSKPVDFIAIISANALPGTNFLARMGNTAAEVAGAAPYSSGSSLFVSPSIQRSDGLYHSHLELPAVQNYRYWRIDIGDHPAEFQASMLVMGKKIEPSRFYNQDFGYGVKDLAEAEFSRLGVIDKAPGIKLRTVEFTLGWQSEAEFEGSFRPMMEQIGTSEVVYLCFDPEPGPYRQARTFMGILKDPPFAKGQRKPFTYGQDFNLLSFI